MQNRLTHRRLSSQLETVSSSLKIQDFGLKPILVYLRLSRFISHGVILGLISGSAVLANFDYSSAQPLKAPQQLWAGLPSVALEPKGDQAKSAAEFANRQFTQPTSLKNYQTALTFPLLTTEAEASESEISAPPRRVEALRTYIVEPGDTVFGIALKFDLAPETILWANPALEDNPDLLRLGQQLTILPVNGVYHQVQTGDTINGIAAKFKVNPTTIIGHSLNQLDSAESILVPGQWLVVPDGIKPYQPKLVSSAAINAPTSALNGTGSFQWPADGLITQEYWSGHRALDIGGWTGAPVYAADAGYVVAAQWDSTGYGRLVTIDHGKGYKSLYAHLSVFFVSVGDEVEKGQQIGTIGSTGNSTGPHLHFELLLNGVKRNPWGFLP